MKEAKEKEIDCNFRLKGEEAKLLMSCLYTEKKDSGTSSKEDMRWIVYCHDHDKKHGALIATNGHKICVVLVDKKVKNEALNCLMFKFPKISVKDDNIVLNVADLSNGEMVVLTRPATGELVELRRDALIMPVDMKPKDRTEMLHYKGYKKVLKDVEAYKNKIVTPRFNPMLLPQYCVEQSIKLMYNGENEEAPLEAKFTNPAYVNTKFILMPLRPL